VKQSADTASFVAKQPEHPDDRELPAGSVRERVDLWWDEHRFYVYMGGLLVLLGVAVLWPRVFITVPAGHRGVLFRTLHGGSVVDTTWDEGLHLIFPWDRLTLYETRSITADLTFPLLTKDGLELEISTSVRYRPVMEMLGTLHQTVGPDYFKRVVSPDIQADLRHTVGDRTAYELYSTEGDILQEARLSATLQLAKQHIELQELLLKKIVLPAIVRQAIEEKHRQEQQVLEYEFRLVREEKEAERKRTEAAGVRDFQNILAEGIAPDVLRWRGIEATLELARSNNAKIVVIGGDGRLPVLLDTPTPGVTGSADRPRAREGNASEPDRVAVSALESRADSQ
jgi:prohibitin 1